MAATAGGSLHGGAIGARPWRLAVLAALAIGVALLVTARRERLVARPVPEQPASEPGVAASSDPEAQRIAAIGAIFADVQATWRRELPQVGQTYREARLVLNREPAPVPCPGAGPGHDPSYCAESGVVELHLDDPALAGPHGAAALAVAHAVGHHVAALLQARGELVADCLAGVWAATTARVDLLPADSVPALLASLAADPRSPARRAEAFRRGFDSGDALACTDSRSGLSD